MITALVDPFEAMFSLQRALDARLANDWLQDQTTSEGPFPPINVFQQGADLLAIIELPGIDKNSLQIEAKENTIRIAGKKAVSNPDGVSVHRRERVAGEFDRTISLPVQLEPDGIKAEYRDGVLLVPAAVRARQAADDHHQLTIVQRRQATFGVERDVTSRIASAEKARA
jgi:HSP20 family protein